MVEDPQNHSLDPVHAAIGAGKFDEALPLLQAAAKSNPGNAEIYNLAGHCLGHLNDHKAALDAYRRAADIRADWPAPYLGAAQVLAKVGDAHASMQALLHVLSFAPQHLDATRQLVSLLERMKPESYLPALQPALEQCFAHPDIDPGSLAWLCAQQLRLSLALNFSADDQDLPGEVVAALASGELWHRYLSRVINTDPFLERLFTRLRRHLCLRVAIDAADAAPLALIDALARQCSLNEYVFVADAEESSQVTELEEFIQSSDTVSAAVACAFAIMVMYRAPDTDDAMRAFAEELCDVNPLLAELCRLTVFEPFEESRIAEKLPVLHPVHDETSLVVQAQYEANPYPRWQIPPAPPAVPFIQLLRREFSSHQDARVEAGGARLLVAGCGTGFEPIDIARRDSSIAVTAIDLSRSSLAYARRQAQAAGCTNIDFYEGDILDLPHTGWEFDLIVCTGVLHHMADPLAGWQVLRDSLAANGMIRISLYSTYARRSVLDMRERIEDLKLAGQVSDIRQVRQTVIADPTDSAHAALLQSDDFYSMSGCRDLLFHVQEQQFTLPEIQAALDDLELRFCGFDLADTSVVKAFSAQNSAPEALLDLDAWDQFEQANPHAFAGMYQFWCEPR